MKEQKLSGGMENGVLHEEERERLLRTHSNTLKCSHILYIIYIKNSLIHKLKILFTHTVIFTIYV